MVLKQNKERQGLLHDSITGTNKERRHTLTSLEPCPVLCSTRRVEHHLATIFTVQLYAAMQLLVGSISDSQGQGRRTLERTALMEGISATYQRPWSKLPQRVGRPFQSHCLLMRST